MTVGRLSPCSQLCSFSGLTWAFLAASSSESPAASRAQVRSSGLTNASTRDAIGLEETPRGSPLAPPLGQLPQHVMQDPAVLVVQNLLRRIQPHPCLERSHLP